MKDFAGLALSTYGQTYDYFRKPHLKSKEDLQVEAGLPRKLKFLEFYPWQAGTKFQALCWAELENHGTRIEDFARHMVLNTGGFHWVGRLLAYFKDTFSLYKAHNVWTSRLLFRNLESLCEELDEDRIRIYVSLPHRYPGSEIFFRICAYSADYMPVRVGHPHPKVLVRDYSDRHFEMVINVSKRKILKRRHDEPRRRSLVNEVMAAKSDTYALRNDFVNVFKSVPDGLAIVANNRLMDANPAFCKIFKIDSLAPLIGKDLLDITGLNQYPAFKDWLETNADELTIDANRDGTAFVWQFQKGGTLNFEGLPSQLLVVRDLTTVYSLERLLQSQHKLASIGRISTSLSHEIKTPLTVISSNLQLAQARLEITKHDDPQLHESISEALRDTERMQNITESLLNLLRKGQLKKLRPVGELVKEAARICQSFARSKQVNIETDPVQEGAELQARAFEFIQILSILIINAIEAAAAQRKIHLANSLKDNETLHIEVKDWGLGVPQDLGESIFQALVTTKPESTGLGLSIARDLATNAGWNLTLTKHCNPTTFLLEIPLGKEQNIHLTEL